MSLDDLGFWGPNAWRHSRSYKSSVFYDRPGVPEYEEHPDDIKEEAEALVNESMAWVMSTEDYPMMEERSETARQAVKNRPDHSKSSNEELVEYAREMVELLEYVWVPSCVAALACSLGPGAVQAICDGTDVQKTL